MATIQGVYVALFGRPADPTGLNFFNGATGNGADLTAIGDLTSTAEYKARFEGQSNTQIITAIYKSLFGRNPEQEGLDFFTAELAAGRLTPQNIAIAVLDGAQGDDKTLADKKIAAADLFTAAIDTPDEIAAYQGTAAAGNGIAFLTAVTAVSPAVDAAAADTAVAALPAAVTGTPGATLTLTAGGDIVNTTQTDASLKSTAGDDDIRAILALSLDTADVIDGGAGNDTLNISLGAMDAASVVPVISNVERINTADIDGLDFTNIVGVTSLWGSATNTTAHTNVTTSTTIGSQVAAATTIDVDFAGAPTFANLAVDNSAAAGVATFTFDATDVGSIKSIDVMASAANKGTATLDPLLTVLETLTASGTGKATIVSGEATIKMVDFSANSGGVTFDASAAAALTSAKGGAGADVLTFDHTALTSSTVTIDTGAGNDSIAYTIGAGAAATAATLTGGAGKDTFTITSANDDGNLFDAASIADDAGLLANLVTITDFMKADDVLNITGLNGLGTRTAQNAVDALLDGSETTLKAVLDKVAGGTAADAFSVFAYDGDTYVYDNDVTAALDAGDGLIKLAGIAVADLDATNFVVA